MGSIGLDLEVEGLGRRGRRAAPLQFAVARSLREADLVLLAAPGQTQAMPVKRISERHHALARLLAVGTAPSEAAAVVGYELSRVSILQGDPSFAELVEFYRSKVDAEFMDMVGQLAGFSKDVLQELRTRLEDRPESFELRDLKDLLVTTLDRTGFGPTHKQEQTVTVNLGERLAQARLRAAEARRELIEGFARDVTPLDAAE